MYAKCLVDDKHQVYGIDSYHVTESGNADCKFFSWWSTPTDINRFSDKYDKEGKRKGLYCCFKC